MDEEEEWMVIELTVPPDEGHAILQLLASSSFEGADTKIPCWWVQQDGSMMRWRPIPNRRKAPSGE